MESAYRQAHSTKLALVRITNDLSCVRSAVILILLDLSAAFDTLDHDMLLQRLQEEMGVRDVTLQQWFGSYTCHGRSQTGHPHLPGDRRWVCFFSLTVASR